MKSEEERSDLSQRGGQPSAHENPEKRHIQKHDHYHKTLNNPPSISRKRGKTIGRDQHERKPGERIIQRGSSKDGERGVPSLQEGPRAQQVGRVVLEISEEIMVSAKGVKYPRREHKNQERLRLLQFLNDCSCRRHGRRCSKRRIGTVVGFPGAGIARRPRFSWDRRFLPGP